MNKILSIVLSVCMVIMHSVPAFAYSSSDAMNVQLSDQAMADAVGGWGSTSIEITGNNGASVTGTITNDCGGACVSCDYTIKDGVQAYGNGGVVIGSGSVLPDQTITFSTDCTLYSYVQVSGNCGFGAAQFSTWAACRP